MKIIRSIKTYDKGRTLADLFNTTKLIGKNKYNLSLQIFMEFLNNDNEGMVKFDIPFFLNILKKNGFNADSKEINIDENLFKIKINKLYSLFDNGFLNILFIHIGEILKKSLISAARGFIEMSPFNTLFIISDYKEKEALVITFPDGADGEARILHLKGRLYHSDEEALNSLRYSDDINELKELFKGYLPYDKVRDEFFEGYKQRFQTLKVLLKKHGLSERESSGYAQRFLGRLMFLYFLQKKGWLARDHDFINKINDYKQLNEVFYSGLNNPDNQMNLPYLNSSLFEREDYITDDLVNIISNEMTSFFKEVRSFFNRYKFTVDESTPLEIEVAIDPYLLGTVFEKMLPENESGNKGTLYTQPAEISFIIRRAISNYLFLNGFDTKPRVPHSSITFIESTANIYNNDFDTMDSIKDNKLQDGIDKYISNIGRTNNVAELDRFEEKLLNATVVDLAVGSGSFIVYYIDEIARIINKAEYAVYKKPTMRVGSKMGILFRKKTLPSPERIKEKLIKNVYGFDIDNDAVEIARLRVWLSYVIDKATPGPLPNLDLNIATVNDSLDTLPFANISSEIKTLREQYIYEPNKIKKKGLRIGSKKR